MRMATGLPTTTPVAGTLVYDSVSRPSGEVTAAADMLAQAAPHIDAYRRQSDLFDVNSRRVAIAMLRGGSQEAAQARYDAMALAGPEVPGGTLTVARKVTAAPGFTTAFAPPLAVTLATGWMPPRAAASARSRSSPPPRSCWYSVPSWACCGWARTMSTTAA